MRREKGGGARRKREKEGGGQRKGKLFGEYQNQITTSSPLVKNHRFPG